MSGQESGPIDRQVLRLLDRKSEAYPLVESTAYEPDPYEPRQLRVSLAMNQYPSSVETARIEIRWFETDDFGFHYVEHRGEQTWQCRWDRHPNPHNARCHFHEPPDCASVVDISLSDGNRLPVLFIVLAAIEERIERLWNSQAS